MNKPWLILVLVVLLVLAGVTSVASGTPKQLPGIALGSLAFLHILRGSAVFGIEVVVLAVLVRGAQGHLPTEITTQGFRYELGGKEASESQLYGQVDEELGTHATAIENIEAEVRELRSDLGALKRADGG